MAVNTLPFAWIDYAAGDWKMAVIWILWGILWLTGWIETVLKKDLGKFVPWLAITEGVITAWVPGFCDAQRVIVVHILPCQCIAVTAPDVHMMAKLCYEIGNRHAPLFNGENESEFLTPAEKPVFMMLEKLGLCPRVVEAQLLPEKRISFAHTHTHAH